MTNIDHEIKVNWSEEDDCFIAISEHYDTVIGVGDTKDEAKEVYLELLNEHLKAQQEGRLIKRPGRPAKNNIKLSCNIPENIKTFIDSEASKRGLNQADIIIEAIQLYQSYTNNQKNIETFAQDIIKVFKNYEIKNISI